MTRSLTIAAAALAGFAMSATEADAQDYYYCQNCGRPHVRYEQPSESFVLRSAGQAVRGTREVAGAGAAVVTTFHPGIRVADWMGLIDRRQIVRNIRGY